MVREDEIPAVHAEINNSINIPFNPPRKPEGLVIAENPGMGDDSQCPGYPVPERIERENYLQKSRREKVKGPENSIKREKCNSE
jgi:hypothetical protein